MGANLNLCQRLADKLIAIGWRPTGDAQHEQLAGAIGELRQMLVPVQMDMLRDQFAMAALPSFVELTDTDVWNRAVLNRPTGDHDGALTAAKAAYIVADAMLRAREGGAA